ncbi:TonB-dependent receptor [Flavobacteriaceae bacterium SZ-1-7]|uniref:SusC/RagA family TonB-linked outer membrane protein n=1 Tax=Tamlana sedimenti TaxID=3134126 RepID=UPI003120B4FA
MTKSLIFKDKQTKKLGFLALMFLFCAVANAQITVTGVVSDQNGPLPGVSVILDGTTNGGATDFDGKFTLSNVPSNGNLLFSYIGYVKQSVAVNGRTTINVVMVEDLQSLDEVVVVGYGSMDRANVTGAITTVDVEETSKVPVPNVVESLRGQVSGLNITKTSGKPGAGVTFKIRGTNSLGATPGDVDGSNQPIIVVDGVPLVGGNMSELDSDDIQSINIIKDAGAGAIYGSSAANGVILITTKSGKSGKTRFEVSSSTGFVQLANEVKPFNVDRFVQFRKDVVVDGNPNTPMPTTQSVLDQVELANYVAGNNVNWLDLVDRIGSQQNVGLAISGGTEKSTFYLNADMYNEKGILRESDYKRYSLRFNADLQATNRIKIGARVQLSKSFADETSEALSSIDGYENAAFAPLLEASPLGSIYDSEGNTTKFVTNDLFALNPLHKFNESIADRKVTRSYINPYIEIDLFEGLKYTLNSYAENRNEFYGLFRSSNYEDNKPNHGQIINEEGTTYLLDNIFNYKKEFGDHGIDATLVFGFQKYEMQGSDNTADYLPSDLLGYNAIGGAPQNEQALDYYTDEWGKYYQVGRLGYNYDSRYSITATIRRDGSSKFGPNNRYGIFPSISGAWNIHNEAFWGDNNKINNLKLRLSYGTLGNDNIPTYLYRQGSRVVTLTNGNTTFTTSNIGTNPNLKWETSKQINVGVDFGLFNNIVTGSIEAYSTKTTDLLLFQSIPGALNNGITSYPSNIGETENKGIEIGLKANILDKGDFSWNAGINWTSNKVKIVRLNEVGPNGEPVDNPANGWFIGQDPQVIYDFDYEGVYQTGETPSLTQFGEVPEPGDAKIRDVNGDGNIDFDDRTFIGSPNPEWYGSINNVFKYKNFELSVLIETVQGATQRNSLYGRYDQARYNAIAVDYWTPTNPSNEFPRVGANSPFSGAFANAIRVQDASFVALRNVSFGYSLDDNIIKKTPFTSISFFVRGNNLKYWTDFKNAYSPENTTTGQYPVSKIWTIGTKISF